MKLIIVLLIGISGETIYLIVHYLNYGFCITIKNGLGNLAALFLILAVYGERFLIKSNSAELKSTPSKDKTLLELFKDKWGE